MGGNMTPEEKTIQRLRRSIPRNRTTVFMVVLWGCLIIGLIFAIAAFYTHLEQVHGYIREQTGQSVLSDLLVEQSQFEIQVSFFFAALLAYSMIGVFAIGKFTVGTRQTKLTLAMWDRIQCLEQELLRRDPGTSHGPNGDTDKEP